MADVPFVSLPASAEAVERFLDCWDPSQPQRTTRGPMRSMPIPWIWCHRPQQDDKGKGGNEEQIEREFSILKAEGRVTRETLGELAVRMGKETGKWMIFPKAGDAAKEEWGKLVRAMNEGRLSVDTLKIAPRNDPATDSQLICVYVTRSVSNQAQVKKVREELRTLGFDRTLNFKLDLYTSLNIYSKNEWNIPASYYFE